MEHTKKLVLVSPEYLEHIKTIPSQSPERTKVQALEEDLSVILDDKNLDDTSKMKRYAELLRQYMTYDIKTKASPTVRLLPNLQPETLQPEKQTITQDILESVPKTLKHKATQLLQKLASSNILTWNDKGELIANERTIQGSNIVDLVNETLRKRKSATPTLGIQDFVKGLAQLNAPRELIGNPDRWREISQWMNNTPRKHRQLSPEIESSPLFGATYPLPVKKQKKSSPPKQKWSKY